MSEGCSWVVTPCRLVNGYKLFEGSYQGLLNPEDGGTTVVRSVGNYVPVNTA